MTVRDERPRLADRGRDITVLNTRPVPVDPPARTEDLTRYLRALRRLADADDLAAAHAGCTLALDFATRTGDEAGLAMTYSQRASVSRRRGDLIAAQADAESAASLPDLPGAPGSLLRARRIAILLDRGDVAAADALLVTDDLPDDPEYLLLRFVRGTLHSAAARYGDALADFYRCGERLAVRGSDRPVVLPWRSAAAQALAQLGATEAAERLVGEEVVLARRGGPASALGRALRIRGNVLPGPAGLAAADEAVRILRGTPRRFELAHALVDFGLLLSAARRKPQARRLLRDGIELAEACGSPGLVARARAKR